MVATNRCHGDNDSIRGDNDSVHFFYFSFSKNVFLFFSDRIVVTSNRIVVRVATITFLHDSSFLVMVATNRCHRGNDSIRGDNHYVSTRFVVLTLMILGRDNVHLSN